VFPRTLRWWHYRVSEGGSGFTRVLKPPPYLAWRLFGDFKEIGTGGVWNGLSSS
jgi:hypothetical protein